MNNLKKLTTIEKEKLIKFQNITYSDKEKLKLNNPTRYNNLIKLQEQFNESQIIISHQKYVKESSIYNNEIIKSLNPAFFVTIKYIEKVANSPERVVSMFSNIKEYLTQGRDYLFHHHVEKSAENNSYHSHLFVSSLKNKTKKKQIEWFIDELDKYRKLNKFSISNSDDSIDVRLFDKKELNLATSLRTNYVGKTDNRNYLSLDLSSNTYNPYAL